MIEILNSSTDPYFNMALEDYAINSLPGDRDYFILWQNQPVVVIGRNQNALEEVNQDYVREKGIAVVRRLSGGGAVYHDQGNLNFTFIVTASLAESFAFERFTRPLIHALAQVGVKAQNQGRNDVNIAGKKFSGNAQYRRHHRLLHHGTILFSTDLEMMAGALNVDHSKMESKGVRSVSKRVTNIAGHLPRPLELKEFQTILTREIQQEWGREEALTLSAVDLYNINRLRDEKYATWDWVYGASPTYNVRRSGRFSWGSIDFFLQVNQGIVKNCRLYGDFFTTGDLRQLEAAFAGLEWREEAIREVISRLDPGSFINQATRDDFLQVMLQSSLEAEQ